MAIKAWFVVPVFMSILSLLKSASVQFHQLQDWRLCNNGPSSASTGKCMNPHNPEKVFDCDVRRLKQEECREVAIELNTFTEERLLQLVPTVDTDHTIRRILVKISSEAIDIKAVSAEIDKFLTERLWWYAQKEPSDWNKHSHRIIVLNRKQHEFERRLRQLSALNFPQTTDECAKSVLMLNRRDFFHPGWYSMLAQFSIVQQQLPYAITAMYVSQQNTPEDSTAFITGSDCPEKINKWECAFLRTTNCPLPTVVTNCTGERCVVNSIKDSTFTTAVFDGACETAQWVAGDGPQWPVVKERAAHPPAFNTRYTQELRAQSKHGNPTAKYLRPYNWKAAPFQGMMQISLEHELYLYSFLLRPSSFYRSRIGLAIKEFRNAHNFSVADRCVAAQIRRGDRVLNDVNITEYCLRPENRDSDMGCASVPFQSVTLEHVVDSAAKLVEPTVRTLIVTTDDEEWLDEQRVRLRSTRPEWMVHNLQAPRFRQSGQEGDGYQFMRYGAGTASGVLLHGSIELSRQCEGFVGHFGCGGTMLVYKSLCAQHRQYEYVCPPSFDVRTIKELQIRRGA